ncbi:MAG TPA: peptidylprolyl isomerase [Planctomycetota bacterium]|nr:peptidylprolyl isomerase [Planctomycetota bacterium]
MKRLALLVLLFPLGCGESKPPPPYVRPSDRPLLRPDAPEMKAKAPDRYKVRFTTSQGAFTITVERAWAPLGADRFYHLVRGRFFEEARFFRVLSGFMVQFGIPADPAESALWKEATITDDPVQESNTRGKVSFATSGLHTRTTQVFINYGNNRRLDRSGFAPFGQVTEGMDVVDKFYSGYGEGAPSGDGPSQKRLERLGNPYLEAEFPKLDYIKKAEILD